MATRKPRKKKRMGRPPLAPKQIRIVARLDEATDHALDALGELWGGISRSEVLRKVVKERAKKEGVV